jgi:hypothetical protein
MVSFIWMSGQIVEHRNMNHRRGSTYGLRDKFGMGSPDREYGSSCRETVVSGCLGNGGTTDFLCSIRIFFIVELAKTVVPHSYRNTNI